MAFLTYADLQDSIEGWLKRTDLTANIPDFISLAEARISRDLRLRNQLVTTTLSTVASVQTLALPSDWLELENITLLTTPATPLVYETTDQLDARYPVNSTIGQPVAYTILGNNLLLGPVPDAVYSVSVSYYQKFSALSTETNWLYLNHPSLYLFGALAEAAPFMLEDDRALMWEAKYAKDVRAVQDADDKAKTSGASLRVRAI